MDNGNGFLTALQDCLAGLVGQGDLMLEDIWRGERVVSGNYAGNRISKDPIEDDNGVLHTARVFQVAGITHIGVLNEELHAQCQSIAAIG